MARKKSLGSLSRAKRAAPVGKTMRKNGQAWSVICRRAWRRSKTSLNRVWDGLIARRITFRSLTVWTRSLGRRAPEPTPLRRVSSTKYQNWASSHPNRQSHPWKPTPTGAAVPRPPNPSPANGPTLGCILGLLSSTQWRITSYIRACWILRLFLGLSTK